MGTRAKAKVDAKQNSQRPSAVKRVHSTFDETEANNMLANGWALMHAGVAHADLTGYQARPCYVLAKYAPEESAR